MRILASVIHPEIFLVEIDLQSGQQRYTPVLPEFVDESVPVKPCRPFGITWDDTYIYVVNNCRIHRFTTELEYLDTIVHGLLSNSHQMILVDGVFYVASTLADSLAKIDNGTITYLHLHTGLWIEDPARVNTMHVNALLRVGDICYVNINGRERGSHIRAYDFPSFDCYEIPHIGGLQSHNIGYDGVLHTISTGTHTVLCGGKAHKLPAYRFLRGMCLTKDYYVIGAPYWNRAHRGQDSQLLWLDRELKVIQSFDVPGEICDIRLLDEFDFAHHVPMIDVLGTNPANARWPDNR